MEYSKLSKNRIKELAKLKQKKYRLAEGRVVVEGIRILLQMKEYGLTPIEQYLGEGGKAMWDGVPAFELRDWEFAAICDSEHPSGLAALFPVPEPHRVDFRRAFYLDGISDPGNLGTIFRLAAAFSLDSLFLSPSCVEISSPKVIRASLGSVYAVPYEVLGFEGITAKDARLLVTDARSGSPLRDLRLSPEDRVIIVLGSEAHGISSELMQAANSVVTVEMGRGIESLNVAVAAGIIAHHLYTG
ncbi:MAG: RNA methyltransferase [Candidatus Syntrophosphaera sp.]|nr:RNA methyltransferase [Candidatus Syntrophosphaera sp.]